MVTFSCPSCGEVMQAADEDAGALRSCPKCAQTFYVPQPGPAIMPPVSIEGPSGITLSSSRPLGAVEEQKPPGIRIVYPEPQEKIEAEEAGAESEKAPAEGFFTLADATATLRKAGEMTRDSTQHEVPSMSVSAIHAVFSSKPKPGTLATAPRKPPWPVGTLLSVDLAVGAFPTPIHVNAEVVRIEESKGRKGYDVSLRIVQADEEAARWIGMLAEREDLREKRKPGTFGV